MIPDADTLPTDPDALRTLLQAERVRHAEAIARVEQERDAAIGESARLRAIIQTLQRYRFGRRSEQLYPDQLALGLEDTEQALSSAEAKEDAARPVHARSARRRINRGALPKSLPRVETIIDIENRSWPCCGGALHAIGEDVAERLDVIPAQFRVLVVRRPKYACRACPGTMVQAPAPPRLIEGGLPTEGLVAMSSSESTRITCRSTAKPRSMPGKASSSTARRWPTGLGARPGSCVPCTNACWSICDRPTAVRR